MAKNNDTTTRFNADISELKAAFQEAGRQIRLANSEFKAASSGMEDWNKSADGVTAKISQLDKVLDAQEKQLKSLNDQYELTVKEYGENSAAAENLKIKINNQQAAINATQQQINSYNQQLANMQSQAQKSESAAEKLRDEIKNQEKDLSDLKDKYASVVLEQGRESDEAKALANQIGSLSGSLNDNRDKLKDVESAANEFDKSVNKANETAEESKSASEKLRDEIKNQEKNLSDLKDKYASVVLEQGRESDEAKALANQINNLSDNLNDNRNRLENAEYAAGEFDGTLEKTDETVRDTSDGFTVMKGVLADLISAGIQAAIQGFKDLAKYAKESYDEYHSGMNNVITATGATGEAVQGLAESYKNTAKSVKGDMSEIGSTLGEVNTRFGYTDEKLEKATEDFMKFASITGTDAVSAVQLVSRAMGDAGIESDKYGEVLDELAIAAQASGISVDKLTENLTKYGAPMRALGFDTKESISIFSAWEKAGVNTEIAFSGMKKAISNWSAAGKDSKEEFKKTLDEIAKAPDIASATTKAIEVFGAKAGPDLADAIQNGRFEFSEFLDIVSDSKGTVENTYNATQDAFDNIALAAQGLKIEIGEQFSNLLSEYEPEIKQAVEAVKGFILNAISFLTTEIIPKIKDFKDKISQFLSEHEPEIKQFTDTVKGYISTAIDFIKTEIIPRIKDFVSWCIEHLPLIEAAIGGIAAAFVAFKAVTFIQSAITAFQALATVIQAVGIKQAILNAIMAANPVGLIVAAIAGLVAAFVILWNKSESFRNFWKGLWAVAQVIVSDFADFFVNLWNNLKLALIAVIGFFISLWDGFWDSVASGLQMIGDFFVNLWNNLKLTLIAVIAYFISLLDGFKDSIISGWQIIADFFIGVWENFKSGWNAVGEFFQSIWNGFTGAIQTIWTAVSDFFINAWESLKNSWSAVGEFFKTVWNGFTGAIQTVWNAVSNFFVTSWETLKSGWSAVGEFFKTVWNGFTDSIVSGWQTVAGFFVSAWENFTTGVSETWESIKSILEIVSDWFNETIIIPVSTFFSSMWDNLVTGAVLAWEGIKTVFSVIVEWFGTKFTEAWTAVKNVFSVGGKIFDGIKEGITSAFTTVVNAIIRGINKVIAFPFNSINNVLDTLRNLSIMDIQPFSWISDISVPKIPELREGGVLRKGKIGFLEGDGDEAVVPLEKNTRWIDEVSARISRNIGTPNQYNSSVDSHAVTNNFYQTNNSPKALSRLEIYRQSKNLMKTLG